MLTILKNNHPILHQKAIPVLEVTPDLRKFASEMFATMHLSKGIGLAAPQVGRSICFIVFDCVQHTMNAIDSGYLFNPEIIESSLETDSAKEGCLSFPGEMCEIKRNKRITVKYLDLSNREVVRSYTGLAARILQHEIDHLQGITMHERKSG